MVDAIAPAVDALEEGVRLDGVRTEVLQRTSDAARVGAESTEMLIASRGRASYVGEAARGVVDPGALVIAWFFECAVGH
jgi:dihydroxyacetone kinase